MPLAVHIRLMWPIGGQIENFRTNYKEVKKSSTSIMLIIMLFCTIGNVLAQKKILEKITSIPLSDKSLDIPKYENGYPFIYWHYCKQKQTQLNLIDPEVSTDSLILRVWGTLPASKKNQRHDLIEIRYVSNKWTAQVINMSVDLKQKTEEKITDFAITEVTPATNWNNVVDSLFYFKVNSLPTDERLPNYNSLSSNYDNRAPTFCFEYATPKIYRFYQYNNIGTLAEHYPEAQNIMRMLILLDREFDIDNLATKFKSKSK